MLKNQEKIDQPAYIFGLSLFSRDISELLITLEDQISNSRSTAYIYTPNPEQVVLAHQRPEFQQALQAGDIVIPDGVGLVLASQLLALRGKSRALSQRIAGREVVSRLLDRAAEHEWRVLLIGGRGYQGRMAGKYQIEEWSSTELAAEVANQPATIIWLSDYQNESQVQACLQSVNPDIVFVALGAPKQELWVEQQRALLEKNKVKLVMVVGGAFDVLTGRLRSAPDWMKSMGLEWLFRLVQEPWRARRQLRLVRFASLVVREFLS